VDNFPSFTALELLPDWYRRSGRPVRAAAGGAGVNNRRNPPLEFASSPEAQLLLDPGLVEA